MSERDDRTPSALDSVIDEARSELVPREIDWEAVERGLEARIAAEAVAPSAARSRAPGVAARVLAVGLAAAAAAVLVVGRGRDVATRDASAIGVAELASGGGTLRATEGAGDVRVGGVVASAGHGLRAGDVVDTAGARAVFERPGKVTWLLEGATAGGRGRARVTSAGDLVALSLEEGAVEAQVTTSDLPESFAVDVSAAARTVRVAVHGTHLRVTRADDRVIVDLSEGVVSIGAPPPVGAAYGALVTAPAHVELELADPVGTMRIERAPAAVRPAVPLDPRAPRAAAPREAPAGPATTEGLAPAPSSQASPEPSAHPAPLPRPAAGAAPVATVLANAVRDCAASARRSRPSEVRVTVSSTLHLTATETGEVQSAVFDPPLLPEIQTCAAAKIYGTRLEASGPLAVPIAFSY